MAKKFRRFGALVMALVMCASMFCTTAFAATTLDNGHIWNADTMSVDVTAGPNEYAYMSVYRAPGHAYEMSYHMVSMNEGVNNDIPQTLVMIDADKDYTWTPTTPYAYGSSNYEVLYCCDAETGYGDGIYYKRMNLEDSDYYTAEQAAQIRAIVTNAYPFVSLEKMKADLKAGGFAEADDLTRADVIAAVQTAIWAFSNDTRYLYSQTFDVPTNTQWGTVMNDYDNEMTADWIRSGKRVFSQDKTVGDRINALVEHLLKQDKVYADKNQVVITKLEMDGDPVQAGNNQARVKLNLELNSSGSGYDDDITITVSTASGAMATISVEPGKTEYNLEILANCTDTITAVVSGTQVLPAGVYFYAPQGGRNISQSLVGVAMGPTPVRAEASIDLTTVEIPEPPVPELPPVTPSTNDKDFTINKEATDLDENDQTDVTLTVPGSFEGNVDVVFVLGGSMNENKKTVDSAISVFKSAMESGKATVRVGIISVEKGQEVILDLNSDEAILSPETYEQLIADKFEYMKTLPAGSTNLHSQLVTAKKMLDAETKASANNKYMFVIATGRTYWFDNAAGEETTIVTKTGNLKAGTSGSGAGVFYTFGNYVWQANRGRNTSYYMIPSVYNNNWDAYWQDVVAWVEADGDKYAFTPDLNEADGAAAFYNWMINNASEWRNLYNGGTGSRYGYTIINPVPTAANFSTGVIDAIPYAVNPEHALGYERAQYETWKAYRALEAAGYNCYALCSEQYRYQNNSSYIAGQASQTQVGHGFMDFLAGGPGKAIVLFEDNGTTGGVLREDFFTPIAEDILYNCSAGSTVVDYIGKNENGNFEFIEKAEYINLNVGGVDYITTQVASKDGANSSYAFTNPNASEPTFWLDYFYGDGETTERFVWTFGENVHQAKAAKLTYKLQLTEKQEAAGEYIVPTNNSATLYPVDSDENKGDPKDFPVPEVDYVVDKPEIPEEPNTPPTITFKPGQASNISFMLLDPATGAVEFLNKIDIEDQTSFEIPTAEGKVSAVFVKQAQSGMFWFAEEVGEDLQQAVIDCLKANNPSYKDHNAVAFGEGEHDLEFKKGHIATYIFSGNMADIVDDEAVVDTAPVIEESVVEEPVDEAPVVEEPVVEEPVVEEPVVEEPVVEEPVVEEPEVEDEAEDESNNKGNNGNGKGKGNNKNKDKKNKK